jgi:hypothetical protein
MKGKVASGWKETRKKVVWTELLAIIGVFALILSGICFNYKLCDGNLNHIMNIESGTSLTILQIQATLTTLTIAIIALLTGNIDETHMGVSISLYFLETKPFILKYKAIIAVEFVLLVVGVLAHAKKFYILVFAFFFSALVIIVLSIFKIYSAFNGKKDTFREIRDYVVWLFEATKEYEKAGQQYVDDWKRNSCSQSVEEFDEYFNLFFHLIKRILEKEGDINTINSLSENITSFLLIENNKKNQIYGIRFVEKFYSEIWQWISANNEKALAMKGQIHLIDRITHEMYVVIDSMDSEDIEKQIKIRHIFDLAIRVSACFGYDDRENNSEVSSINRISRTMGGILQRKIEKGNIVDKKWWIYLINEHLNYLGPGIPAVSSSFFGEAMALKDFNLCYGFLLSGQAGLVKEAIFLNDLDSIFTIKQPSYVLRIMLIHCYMYYLAYRESTDCIDEDIQNQVKDIFSDSDVVKAVGNFYYYNLIETRNYLSADLEKKLELTLEKYELFPKHSNGKMVIIESVVKEYYLFIVLSMLCQGYREDKVSALVEVDSYMEYLSQQGHDRLRKHFVELSHVCGMPISNEKDRIRIVENLLPRFDNIMITKYKEKIIQRAAEDQREYVHNDFEKKTIEKYSAEIQESFETHFGQLDKEIKNAIQYKKIHVLTFKEYTRNLNYEINPYYINTLLRNFGEWLTKEIVKKHDIISINRDKRFESDKSFRQFLKSKRYGLFIGSQFVFESEEYENYEEHKAFFEGKKCVFVPTMISGIAMNEDALYIKLDKIIVDVHPTELEETSNTRTNTDGSLSYFSNSGVAVDFSEEELRNHIHNEMKTIEVFLNVTIGLKKNTRGNICTIFTREA